MIQWIGTWFVTAVTFLIAAFIVPGFRVRGFAAALWASALVGLFNMFLRPVLMFLAFPLNVLTLGLFTFVVNAFVLRLAAYFLEDFEISGWLSAIVGAIILAIVQTLLFGLLS